MKRFRPEELRSLSTDELVELLRDWVGAKYPEQPAESMRIVFKNGKKLSLLFPPRACHVPDAAVDLSECETDIVNLLAESGKRLTTEEVMGALTEAGKLHGDSTIKGALAQLTRRKGMLTNQRDDMGKGYGLSEW